jgi:uncharacterized protein
VPTNTYLGLQYPLVMTHRGILAQKTGVNQIKADLLQLLLTNPGERVMLPTYGTALRTLAFEPNDATIELTATNLISAAITLWEPRIAISNITVTSNFSPSDLGAGDTGTEIYYILGVKIEFFDPQDISVVNSLVLELPMGGT